MLAFALCCARVLSGNFRIHFESDEIRKKLDFALNKLQRPVHILELNGVYYLLLKDETGKQISPVSAVKKICQNADRKEQLTRVSMKEITAKYNLASE